MTVPPRFSRAQMIALGSAGVASNVFAFSGAQASTRVSSVDTGTIQAGNVVFPDWTARTDPAGLQPPHDLPRDQRIGFAIVGLGKLALENILPAFAQSKRAKPVALVSGRPEKAHLVADQYGIAKTSVYDYADFDAIRDNPEIQVVYIVLPNALHREYVVRAAAAGKHVLCEKPMATSPHDCEAMISAAQRAGKLLMIAYRCQYDPFHRDLVKLLRKEPPGSIKLIEASNMQNMADAKQWRLHKKLAGGGSLPDVGIYCLNAARYLTGEEPSEVSARIHTPANDERFREVEETVQFSLAFPGGTLANCASSYGAFQSRTLSVHTATSSMRLDNAFAYDGLRLHVSQRDGHVTLDSERKIEAKNQFALELDHMADCVITGRNPHTPGEEGLRDQRLMAAIYASAAEGKPVAL